MADRASDAAREQSQELAHLSSLYEVDIPPPRRYSINLNFSGDPVRISISLPILYPLERYPDISIAADSLKFEVTKINRHIRWWLTTQKLGSPLISKAIEELRAVMHADDFKAPVPIAPIHSMGCGNPLDTKHKDYSPSENDEEQLSTSSETREISECGICYEDLSSRRVVTLGCGHVLHRTCLLDWCESGSNKISRQVLFCPICDVPFGNECRDENNKELPLIVGFGPTGQPSQSVLVYSLKHCDSEFYKYFYDQICSTTNWLALACNHLRKGRESGKSEEYLRDVISEIKKLIERLAIYVQQEEEYVVIKKRIELGAKTVVVFPNANIEDEPVTVAPDSAGDNEPICSICLGVLSTKRSTTLQCRHTFHHTCIMQWYESGEQFDAIYCCVCRTPSTGELYTDGMRIQNIYPVELMQNDVGVESIEWLAETKRSLTDMFDCLAQSKRRALRDGKGAEYVEDIVEEMSKFKRRVVVINELLLHATETQEFFRLSQQIADAASVDAVMADDVAM